LQALLITRVYLYLETIYILLKNRKFIKNKTNMHIWCSTLIMNIETEEFTSA